MSDHRYLRAYMAGISVPTPLLLLALTLFSMVRFVYHVPIPVERMIVFPMAIVPNLFGVWNMLHVASRARTHLLLGIHGAILPFLLAPAGFLLGRGLGFLKAGEGFLYFDVVAIGYAYVALAFGAVLIFYYLIWKYVIGFFNGVLGISE